MNLRLSDAQADALRPMAVVMGPHSRGRAAGREKPSLGRAKSTRPDRDSQANEPEEDSRHARPQRIGQLNEDHPRRTRGLHLHHGSPTCAGGEQRASGRDRGRGPGGSSGPFGRSRLIRRGRAPDGHRGPQPRAMAPTGRADVACRAGDRDRAAGRVDRAPGPRPSAEIVGRDAHTSTTTGSTIGRRLSRS